MDKKGRRKPQIDELIKQNPALNIKLMMGWKMKPIIIKEIPAVRVQARFIQFETTKNI